MFATPPFYCRIEPSLDCFRWENQRFKLRGPTIRLSFRTICPPLGEKQARSSASPRIQVTTPFHVYMQPDTWMAEKRGTAMESEGRKEGSRKRVKNSALPRICSKPFQHHESCASTQGGPRHKTGQRNKKREAKAAIQSTRPACKHAECLRHQVVLHAEEDAPPYRCRLGLRRRLPEIRWRRTVQFFLLVSSQLEGGSNHLIQ